MSRLPARGRDAGRVFTHAFDGEPATAWSSPGRVNLIGEHTDYNGGLCLPLAVGFGVDCAASLTTDGLLRVASAQRPGEVRTLELRSLAPGVGGWVGYVAGVLWVLQQAGIELPGLAVALDSDLPEGAGLSSSAALECAVLGAAAQLLGLKLEPSELARLAQQAENDFVGVPCGRMDQLISACGRAGHALLVDARAETIQHVPLDLAGHGLELLVVDTRAAHALVDGGYAQRRRECEQAAAALGVASLREARSLEALEGALRARARHVVTENDRVEQVVTLLEAGAVPEVGPHLTQSHISLRDDFAVSVIELDVAVEVALEQGALGARMTGGGFGGSIVALVEEGTGDAVAATVERAFASRGFAEPRSFLAVAAAGLHRSG